VRTVSSDKTVLFNAPMHWYNFRDWVEYTRTPSSQGALRRSDGSKLHSGISKTTPKPKWYERAETVLDRSYTWALGILGTAIEVCSLRKTTSKAMLFSERAAAPWTSGT
jgi:hypothetical protein